MTELEKLKNGMIYDPMEPAVFKARRKRCACFQYG